MKTMYLATALPILLAFVAPLVSAAGPSKPVPGVVEPAIADTLLAPPPGDTRLGGWLGARVQANETQRLLAADEDAMLDAFRTRTSPWTDPRPQRWVGEHVGKWLHAATLAWAGNRDPQLKAKIDRVAGELMQQQEADGYLGTWPAEFRWRRRLWDVWVHKYNMIGLLTYHQYTGDEKALQTSQRMADLLIATFPAQMSIVDASGHAGMAATSVLQPIVLLYRLTGDAKYLDFAKYIVSAYDDPEGPRLITGLLEHGKVAQVGNGKAYEMMSNFMGVLDLARVTGERKYITAIDRGWHDIVANQLYVTGTASHGEGFKDDHNLPNDRDAKPAETCVTVSWIQLNASLLELTGEARFGDEIERSFYNHLAGAQLPDGTKWCYYTPLSGQKPYTTRMTCCRSSGQRAIAIAPQLTALSHADEAHLVINSFETATNTLPVAGEDVTISATSRFPAEGVTRATVSVDRPTDFALSIRAPQWAGPLSLSINGEPVDTKAADGYVTLPLRNWDDGDTVEVRYTPTPGYVRGVHTNEGLAALTWGPFVLAFDAALNPTVEDPQNLRLAVGPENVATLVTRDADQPLRFKVPVRPASGGEAVDAVFVPFAEAGVTGGSVDVWLPIEPD